MNPVPDCGEDSYRGSGKLTCKKAIIAGGDSGIGRAVAIAFAGEGAAFNRHRESQTSDVHRETPNVCQYH
jgi:NAD(P)-dependent dehydrogenase (short-subunit alcohol dehydrogenase family)